MMNNIIFITGMPGAGKSTISRGVAEHFPQAMHIPVDELRHMMVTGRAKPSDGLTEEAIHQLQMGRSTAIYMANLYASRGVDVVIDDVCWPPNFVEDYKALFENPVVLRVLLLPNPEALADRIIKRGGPIADLYVKNIPRVYNYLEPMPKDGWIVLDSGEWTIEQTVDEVLSRIGAVRSDSPM